MLDAQSMVEVSVPSGTVEDASGPNMWVTMPSFATRYDHACLRTLPASTACVFPIGAPTGGVVSAWTMCLLVHKGTRSCLELAQGNLPPGVETPWASGMRGP